MLAGEGCGEPPGAKLAVIVLSVLPVSGTAQTSAAAQPPAVAPVPLQPVKVSPSAGAAVSVTVVASGKSAAQVLPPGAH